MKVNEKTDIPQIAQESLQILKVGIFSTGSNRTTIIDFKDTF
jgi:hypothetical protein